MGLSLKVDLSAPEVDQQIELLAQYPEIAERHYKPALKRSVALLHNLIQPQIPMGTTGRALKTFGSKVTGKGVRISGQVGWYRKGSPFYVRFLEGGAKEHEFGPRGSKQTLVRQLAGTSGSDVVRFFKSGSAQFVRKSYTHPGVKGRGFMEEAWARAQGVIPADIQRANEAVLKELAVP